MKILLKLFICNVALLFCVTSYSQITDTIAIKRNNNGIVEFAWFKINESSDRVMSNDTIFLKSILNAKKDDSFRLIKLNEDKTGYVHKKFQQYYKGVKVEYCQYLIHGKNGFIETINGHFQVLNIPNIIPAFDERQSLKKALDFIGAEKYKWV
ncbi:MAG: hypothetical protein WCE64_05870 [Bacteroidales bacterium]